MTTQPQTPAQQAAEQFREEIRAAFDLLHVEIAELRADLAQMREGLTHAAQPAPTASASKEMTIEIIVMTYDDNGKPAYKAKGAPYQSFGVRVWPEILPILGIDPATLKPGPNTITPIRASLEMGETKDDNGNPRQSPRKVTGRAS